MSNPIRDKSLKKELEKMEKLAQESSMFQFKVVSPIKEYPDKYLVGFTCQGMENPNSQRNQHVIEIYLPMEFPRKAPILRFKTPIFHPNIRGLLNDTEKVDELIGQVGGINSFMDTITEDEDFKEIFDSYICLDVLAENWSPDYSLYDICVELAGMIQFQRYNIGDPLNKQAAVWTLNAEANGDLPIDKRDFRDKLQHGTEKKEPQHHPKIRLIKTEDFDQ